MTPSIPNARVKRRATRKNEFNYPERARKAALGTDAYGRLWTIVDGGVRDALAAHPDYLTPKGARSARTSIVKRVTGTVIGFAEQSAKGRVTPAETAPRALQPEAPASPIVGDAGAGSSRSAPLSFSVPRLRVKDLARAFKRKHHLGIVRGKQAINRIEKDAAFARAAQIAELQGRG